MNAYVKLAKAATEYFIRQRQVLPLRGALSPELARQRACYVYLYANPGHRLRTMYGEPFPRQACLGQEIINHTVSALTRVTLPDIRRSDLPSIIYTVAVLEPLQRISDAAQLQPDHCGLYLHSDQGKSAIILPRRAGVDTAQDQIATAMRESGANLRQDTITMYRFVVTYYE